MVDFEGRLADQVDGLGVSEHAVAEHLRRGLQMFLTATLPEDRSTDPSGRRER